MPLLTINLSLPTAACWAYQVLELPSLELPSLESPSWKLPNLPAPNAVYGSACRQGSMSVGRSVQHALRPGGIPWPHCSTVRPCGVSCQAPGHVRKSGSGTVSWWGSFPRQPGSNCTAGSEFALPGGPGWVSAYDSQGAPCPLLHWTLPLVWCIHMAGNVPVPPDNRQQQVCSLHSAS